MRQERGWSQQRAFEELAVGLGYKGKSRASYVSLEQGREPNASQQAFLVKFFGKAPDDAPEPTPEPTLAAALSELAAELRASRAERADLGIRLEAMEGAIALLAQRSGVTLPGLASLGGRAG